MRIASQTPSTPWASAALRSPAPSVARDARGGAVGEEDAEADDGLQDHGRDAEPGELRRAEVSDDRGVGEQEQRLGDEGEERGDGQAEDLPVDCLHGRQRRCARVVPAAVHDRGDASPILSGSRACT